MFEDECFALNANRARRVALPTVIFSQVPLMFFMAYMPPEASVEGAAFGMGLMTRALGCGAFAASFLFHSRVDADE